jgi:hypothetical protein
MSAGLSEHEVMRDERLPMWGAWGRWDTDKPNNQRLGCSIYQMGRADRQGEGESGEEWADLPSPKMDIADCERLDGYIRQLSELHRQIIRQKYYKRLAVHRLDVDAAVRALLDLMADNRKVVDVMKRMGWT